MRLKKIKKKKNRKNLEKLQKNSKKKRGEKKNPKFSKKKIQNSKIKIFGKFFTLKRWLFFHLQIPSHHHPKILQDLLAMAFDPSWP